MGGAVSCWEGWRSQDCQVTEAVLLKNRSKMLSFNKKAGVLSRLMIPMLWILGGITKLAKS